VEVLPGRAPANPKLCIRSGLIVAQGQRASAPPFYPLSFILYPFLYAAMTTKTFLGSLLAACLVLVLASGCASEQEKQGGLAAKAKVSKEDAEKIALSRVPGGTVSKGDIEEQFGKLVWSFDITAPGTSPTRVAVDAMTGTVVAVDVEKTPPDATTK
jgi:hypothetical protein